MLPKSGSFLCPRPVNTERDLSFTGVLGDLLRSSPEVRAALSQRYRHILVDEFQDTDPTHCEILFLLCGEDADGDWIDRRLRARNCSSSAIPSNRYIDFAVPTSICTAACAMPLRASSLQACCPSPPTSGR